MIKLKALRTFGHVRAHIMTNYFNANQLPRDESTAAVIDLTNGLKVLVWKDTKTGSVAIRRTDTGESRYHSATAARDVLQSWESEPVSDDHADLGQHVGYVRVSTVTQNTDRQLAGVRLDRVFTEKCSAKTTDRLVWKDCLNFLRQGDTLHVHSLDRVCRSGAGDAVSIVEELTGRGIAVVFHKEGWTFSGELTATQRGTLGILASVAQMERELILERQREGQQAAKAAGKHIGRPKGKTVDTEQLKVLIESGMSVAAMARELGISRQSLYRRLDEAGLR